MAWAMSIPCMCALSVSLGALVRQASSRSGSCYAPAIALTDPHLADDDGTPPGAGSVEIRLHVPAPVADWLTVKAGERYKRRGEHVRDLLVDAYRKATVDAPVRRTP